MQDSQRHEVLAAAAKSVDGSGGWCSPIKAMTLAAIVLDVEPMITVEIGVWTGASLVPMLLALKHLGRGRAIAIDPWSPAISVQNEIPENRQWWGSVDHDAALAQLRGRMIHHDVTPYCDIWRHASDDCQPPSSIDVLHVDGSHTDQAIRDVERFGANIRKDGVLIMDDIGWTGGGVDRAIERAHVLGFIDCYQIESWLVMQKDSS